MEKESKMKVDLNTSNPEEFVLSVVVPKDVVDDELSSVFSGISKAVSLPGFRKGKAPLDVALKNPQFGPQIMAEASARLVHNMTAEALRVKGIQNADNPNLLEQFKPTAKKRHLGQFNLDGSFEFGVSLTPPPTLELPDLDSLEISPDFSMRKSDVDTLVMSMLKKGVETVAVDRPSQEGDEFVWDVKASVEGEWAEALSLSDDKSLVGSEHYFSDLQEFVVDENTDLSTLTSNKSVGDTFSFSIDFPSDFPMHAVKGKRVDYEATVKSVSEIIVPELNDEFAKSHGHNSVDEMIESLTNDWEVDFPQKRKSVLYNAVMNAIMEETGFEPPESWVNNEVPHVLARFGVDPNDSQKVSELMSNEKNAEWIRELAKVSVSSSFILDKVFESNDELVLTEEFLEKELDEAGRQVGLNGDIYLNRLRESHQYESFLAKCQQNLVLDWLAEKSSEMKVVLKKEPEGAKEEEV